MLNKFLHVRLKTDPFIDGEKHASIRTSVVRQDDSFVDLWEHISLIEDRPTPNSTLAALLSGSRGWGGWSGTTGRAHDWKRCNEQRSGLGWFRCHESTPILDPFSRWSDTSGPPCWPTGVPLLPATAEADPINFAPRVKIPVLMINGRHDFAEPVDKTQKPMFRWFGTPEKDGPQRRRPLLWLPGRDRNAGVCHGRDRPSPCRPRPGSDFSSRSQLSHGLGCSLSATAAAMSGGAFRVSP